MCVMPRQRVLIPLRWSDTDAYGHINNVLFLRLIEEARVQALADKLQPAADGPGTALLVARSEIEHRDPLLFRVAPVTIDLWVTRIGAADLNMGFEILDPPEAGNAEGAIYAQAELLLVVFDQATKRPRRITKEERILLESWRDEPIRWWRRRPSAS